MPEVKLAITQPANGAIFEPTGPPPVTSVPVALAGRVLSTGHPPLFYRWYSTLNKAPDKDKVALNWNDPQSALDVRGHTAALDVGSHVITLAAKDQAADTVAAIVQVRYAGLAGGDSKAPAPCVVHVLLARIPSSQPVALSKNSSLLRAAAPFKWPDDDYVAVNKLRYVWRFELQGAPPNAPKPQFAPGPLRFVKGTELAEPMVEYSGPLPTAVSSGNYTLVLRVEHADQPTRGHEQRLNVTIGA